MKMQIIINLEQNEEKTSGKCVIFKDGREIYRASAEKLREILNLPELPKRPSFFRKNF
jgi:hypothetical protein